MTRPRIALVGRFTTSASALRYAGVVSSRALLESVWAAGGDPVTFLPVASSDWHQRLAGVHGVLLAGGGDIDPARYGQDPDPSVYDVDAVQDDADFGIAAAALELELPMLAVCRGLHVLNVLRGGTLVQDMPVNHRHHVHQVDYLGTSLTCSCYHHQAVDRVGQGLTVLARATDGAVEALGVDGSPQVTAVQWHPEDTAGNDPAQAALFAQLIEQARARS